MNIKKTFVALTLVIGMIASVAAHGWAIQEDRGSTVLIWCEDGSYATVGKSKGGWTVISPGKNGTAGGQFDIVGQAALTACRE
jgi:hypothetical protein